MSDDTSGAADNFNYFHKLINSLSTKKVEKINSKLSLARTSIKCACMHAWAIFTICPQQKVGIAWRSFVNKEPLRLLNFNSHNLLQLVSFFNTVQFRGLSMHSGSDRCVFYVILDGMCLPRKKMHYGSDVVLINLITLFITNLFELTLMRINDVRGTIWMDERGSGYQRIKAYFMKCQIIKSVARFACIPSIYVLLYNWNYLIYI